MSSRIRRILLIAVAGCLVVVGAGCQRSLFPSREHRTQFDAYDAQRGIFVPLEEPDVFGNPQPALRARLTKSQ